MIGARGGARKHQVRAYYQMKNRNRLLSVPLLKINFEKRTTFRTTWSGWGIDADSQHVVVYTDGSHDASSSPQPTSSWAVTVADDWFHSHFSTIPVDEQILAVIWSWNIEI